MLKQITPKLSFKNCVQLQEKYQCKVVAISKKQSVESIRQAYQQGFRHFGESYVQEALLKQEALQTLCPDIIWHFVGNIQTNKLKGIVSNFSYLHSVGSLKAVQKIIAYQDQLASLNQKPLKIFLQINISKDVKKSGFILTESMVNSQQTKASFFSSPDFLKSLEAIKNTLHVHCQGLMTMPFLYSDLKQLERDFQKLQAISQHYSKQINDKLDTSMGTSRDYKLALNAGADWVRLGESIFGPRELVARR
ncbi:MAG: YggS family pyridoxal phosphate-dependent enzyme [Bdellovibrionaceae bacterium]|nr:YggS family pyridoxal phosphate-dependent enzyme [Pseudobdellovibrionaceae bacterium]